LTPTYYVPAGAQLQQLAKAVERCAHKLGPRRTFYTTRETVEDLEDIRRAAGIDKLVLVGVSYGSRDAMAYARTYPEHTERVVLDSLVADPGVDPFSIDSVRAIPRVLERLCRGDGCRGITSDPVADLRTLVARLAQGPLRAKRAVSAAGCRVRPPITRSRLYGLFAAADVDPTLLAQLPVAVAQAARGDAYQLSELVAGLQGAHLYACAFAKIIANGRSQRRFEVRDEVKLVDKTFSPADQVATLCEEGPLPWRRDAPPSERRRATELALSTFPDSAFDPFDRSTVLYSSTATLCKYWLAAPEPPLLPTGPLPAIPTLILAGLDDLRTPGEDALALARATPTAQFLAVPDVGHSVLSSSGCGRRAFAHFMAGQPISPCHAFPVHRPAPARRVESIGAQLEKIISGTE
jgi:pimeloyl-ACP methyl ester carboxylesterase